MGGNKRKTPVPSSTTVDGPAPGGQDSAVVELRDMGDHIEKLKQVSLTTQKLVNLLGDQLQGLSGSIPILRGFEIVCVQLHPIVLARSEWGAIAERIKGILGRMSRWYARRV